MSDHAEEQEMEAEALQAIFDTHFTILEPQRWQIAIYPEMTSDIDEHEQLNHVGVHLIAELPSDYPEVLPKLDCQIIKGLVDDHRQELLSLASEEAQANQGVPSIFAIAERLREWLAENNQKGLDDLSMHAQMLRKQQAKEKEKQKAESAIWESQEAEETFTQAELEEMEVRRRRAEGTPCNKENFEAWRERFEEEMASQENDEEEDNDEGKGGSKRTKKQGSATVDKSDRMTGFEFFKSKATNMEALEAAAEAAETQEMEEDEEDDDEEEFEDNEKKLDVDVQLFEDDVDLDDLDFDEDEDEEDVDI